MTESGRGWSTSYHFSQTWSRIHKYPSFLLALWASYQGRERERERFLRNKSLIIKLQLGLAGREVVYSDNQKQKKFSLAARYKRDREDCSPGIASDLTTLASHWSSPPHLTRLWTLIGGESRPATFICAGQDQDNNHLVTYNDCLV